MQRTDYYRILEIPPISTGREITRQYRAIAKMFHPGGWVGKPEEDFALASREMNECADAYNFLKDDRKRKEYDQDRLFQFRVREPGSGQPHGKESFLARCVKRMGKGNGAPDEARREREPWEELFSRGITCAQQRTQESLEEARKEFAKIITLNPFLADAYYNLGLIHYLLGQFDEAIPLFERAASLEPGDTDSHALADMLLRPPGTRARMVKESRKNNP